MYFNVKGFFKSGWIQSFLINSIMDLNLFPYQGTLVLVPKYFSFPPYSISIFPGFFLISYRYPLDILLLAINQFWTLMINICVESLNFNDFRSRKIRVLRNSWLFRPCLCPLERLKPIFPLILLQPRS